MAKTGNHGIIIPRDAALLRRLYWDENKTLPEIAAMFGVNHKSIHSVFVQLGIPRRGVGHSRKRECQDCGGPIYRIKHTNNGSLYGSRCRRCRRLHYNKLASTYVKKPEIKAKRDAYMLRWYLAGAINPQGEEQWLTKGKHLLRSARRLLQSPRSRRAYELQNEVSELARILRI